MPRVVVNFTSTSLGGFVAPAGVTSVQLVGWGGGGGGGSGGWGNPLPDFFIVGGAGGGGALRDVTDVLVVPGTAYDVVIGSGGLGDGADGGVHPHGGNGGDTLFRISPGGPVLATFRGAQGGTSSFSYGTSPAWGRVVAVLGGNPFPGDEYGWIYVTAGLLPARGFPGVGGYGTTADVLYGRSGAGSVQGFVGGSGGAHGASDASYHGGGGGGGGAAGPAGDGGNGGAGGFGKTSGASGAGEAGTAASANSGAGGGGGGSGGARPNGAARFGPGGAGGSGRVTVVYVV